MNKDKKIKVIWLCAYSDVELRSHLKFPRWHWSNVLRRMLHMDKQIDYAVWDTYAIHEWEQIAPSDIELHIVAPHAGISHMHEFHSNGIYYHIFWSEWDIIKEKIKRRVYARDLNAFKNHRRIIKDLIEKIQPNIVHVIGIENKFHSMAVLDLPDDMIVISQLQTLVNDDRFKYNCGATEKEYAYDSEVEKLIMRRSDYIGIAVPRYREIIKKEIKHDAVFVETTLALKEPVEREETVKEFDFVYFSADISKAVDLAIEAFAEAKKNAADITLDIVGGFSADYKNLLDERIKKLNIENSITFEGKLPSHEDVIRQIRKSRFALLPLKIDIVSGTIREAMANGLPVVTTITPGTPKLNEKVECVLLSKTGDYVAMAENMLRLVKDPDYAEMLRTNSFESASEGISNREVVEQYCKVYRDCIKSL